MAEPTALLHRYAGVMLAERVTIGIAAALAPGPLLTAFGIDPSEDSPTLRYFARLFGRTRSAWPRWRPSMPPPRSSTP